MDERWAAAAPLAGAASLPRAASDGAATARPGSSALLINVNAFAQASGVWEALVEEWSLSEPHAALSRSRGSRGIGARTLRARARARARVGQR